MTSETGPDLGEMAREDALVAAIGPVAGLKVVDMGCGEGKLAKALAARGATVIGYDPFIPGTDWTTEGEGAYRLSHATADSIPEPDASVDAVLFCYSFHHVPQEDMAGALAEARRVLKPGGKLCVAEPLAEGPGQYVGELYHDETEVRRNALAALKAHAAPAFADEKVVYFSEGRRFTDFDAYLAMAISNMRFNDYTEAQLMNPEVKSRFEKVLAETGGRFSQKVRVNIFA